VPLARDLNLESYPIGWLSFLLEFLSNEICLRLQDACSSPQQFERYRFGD